MLWGSEQLRRAQRSHMELDFPNTRTIFQTKSSGAGKAGDETRACVWT